MSQKTNQFGGNLNMLSPYRRLYGVGMVGVFLIAFALSFVVVGCSRKGGGGLVPGGGSGGGNGISFRAVSSGSSATKTVYGGPEKTVGNVEPIYWSNGDILTIACAQARSSEGAVLTSADYELVPTASDASKAMIYPVNNGNGLWWGTANPHHFYSLYPSKAMMDAAYKSLVDVATNGTVKGVFPTSQNPTGQSSKSESGITTVTLSPDMRYGYLWSGVDAAPKSSSVSMTFKPLFTAFEFVVGGDAVGGDLTLKSFELSSSTCALSGNFTAQIAEGGGSVSLTSVPARTTSNNTLSLTFPIGSNAVVVSSTKQARFTVLTFAGRNLSGTVDEKISDLTLKFTFERAGSTFTRTLLLKRKGETTPMIFDGRKKYRITNLSLPTLKEATFTVEVIDYDAVNSDLGFGNVTVGDMSETDGNNLDFS